MDLFQLHFYWDWFFREQSSSEKRTVGKVEALQATDSQNLAKIQQACHLGNAGVIELAWEILRQLFGYWAFYASMYFRFLKSAGLWFVKIMHKAYVYSMTVHCMLWM